MKKISLMVLILLGSLGYAQFFSTLGFEIVDPQGKPYFLKGYGLGGWLVPEGYMLKMPGFGSPSSIRAQIIDVIGNANAELFFREYRQNYVTEKDIALIAEWGFNSLRLPFHYQFFSPIDSPGVFIQDGFQIIDTLLNWCKKYNLYLILDMHCAPGGQNAGNISDSDGEAKLWTVAANQERTLAIWRYIAQYYAKEPQIIGYDLLNEPVLPDGMGNNVLRSFFVRLKDTVREVDPNHILFIEGNWYATDFSGLPPRFDGNMVWAFHKYWSETDLASIQTYRNLRTQTITPLWLGESGENSNPWFYEVITLANEQNIGWNWWAHKKFNTTTSPLSAILPAGFDQLINYWKGQGPKPSRDFAYRVLMEMVENLKLEKCVLRTDVIAALTDPEFGTKSKPYRIHIVPGTINAADYDLGTQGIAYYDLDYKKTRYDLDQPWNKGYTYRNDGVDIETGTGVNHIGWIETGEWLNYSVEIVYPGNYDITLRLASPYNTGRIQLLLDEQVLVSSIPVPNTGGWQTWQNVVAAKVALPRGSHRLKVLVVNGGFNFQSLTFSAEENALIEEVTPNVLIGTNYPNPFNEKTVIPVILTQASPVKVSIYDLKGQEIKVLFDGILNPGLNDITWDGTNHQNKRVGTGVYYYKISTDSIGEITRAMLLVK
jgi:hypothetical protein